MLPLRQAKLIRLMATAHIVVPQERHLVMNQKHSRCLFKLPSYYTAKTKS